MLCCRWLWDTLYTVHSCAICTHKARAAIRVASFTYTWQRVNSSSSSSGCSSTAATTGTAAIVAALRH